MVDAIPDRSSTSTQTVPMQVLCLGMCRTGTQSLAEALSNLGYSPIYHMREVRQHGHEKYWIAALERKFENKGRPLSREEFDEFLGGWAVGLLTLTSLAMLNGRANYETKGVSDIPAAIFYAELITAYPEAKVILTVRDEQKWFESMKSTIWSVPPTKPLSALIDKYIWKGDPDSYGIEAFKQHNKDVLKAASEIGREILVYEVKEGWSPLCRFVGKEVPSERGLNEDGTVKESEKTFPRSDDWAKFGWKKIGDENIASRDAK